MISTRSIVTNYCFTGGLNSAKSLHDEMLVRVFHAPMAFFDTTPIGMPRNEIAK